VGRRSFQSISRANRAGIDFLSIGEYFINAAEEQ
jgi:hypothetical protein